MMRGFNNAAKVSLTATSALGLFPIFIESATAWGGRMERSSFNEAQIIAIL